MIKIFLLALLLSPAVAAPTAHKIKLTDVKTITLSKGQMTTARRSSPIPQLRCHGHLCRFAPETVQAYNKGTDGIDVQWKFDADLPGTLAFAAGSDVNCEGWDYPNDPYVLVGSCGLTYSLIGTPPRSARRANPEHTGTVVAILLLGAVLMCCAGDSPRRHHYGGFGGSNALSAAAGGFLGASLARPRRRRSSGWGTQWSSRRGASGFRRVSGHARTSRR